MFSVANIVISDLFFFRFYVRGLFFFFSLHDSKLFLIAFFVILAALLLMQCVLFVFRCIILNDKNHGEFFRNIIIDIDLGTPHCHLKLL